MSSSIEPRSQPDVQLEAIADRTRRHLLFELLEDAAGDTPIEIADRVGDPETAEPIEMRHVHLPKLADHGFVRWDREHRLVRRGPRFDEIEPLLTLLYGNADELAGEWF